MKGGGVYLLKTLKGEKIVKKGLYRIHFITGLMQAALEHAVRHASHHVR